MIHIAYADDCSASFIFHRESMNYLIHLNHSPRTTPCDFSSGCPFCLSIIGRDTPVPEKAMAIPVSFVLAYTVLVSNIVRLGR